MVIKNALQISKDSIKVSIHQSQKGSIVNQSQAKVSGRISIEKIQQSKMPSIPTSKKNSPVSGTGIKIKFDLKKGAPTMQTGMSQNDRNAYHQLLAKVADSYMSLKKVKNGQPNDFNHESKRHQIPLLQDQSLRQDLRTYINSSKIFIPKDIWDKGDHNESLDYIQVKNQLNHKINQLI